MSSLSDEAKYANKADSNGNPTYLRGSSCIYLGVNNDTTLFKIFIPPFHFTVYAMMDTGVALVSMETCN